MPVIDWPTITSSLRNGNCCLLLGPEIPSMQGDDPARTATVPEEFSAFLKKKLVDEGVAFNADISDFQYLANKLFNAKYVNRAYLFDEIIAAFATELAPLLPDFYKQLALLPFKSVVCTTPDNFFSKALSSYGFEFEEKNYNYKGEYVKLEMDPEMQLVLNILGSFSEPKSVSFSDKAQLEQIKCILNNVPQLGDNIKARFQDPSKTFIFLGFNFNEWYFRLLMDALKVPNPAASYYPLLNKDHKVAVLAQEFYTDSYGIRFVDPDAFSFISNLTQQYEQAYGSLTRTLRVALDYVEADNRNYTALRNQLNFSFSGRKVEFITADDAQAGGDKNAFAKVVQEADVYMPFVSEPFLNEPGNIERVRQSLDNPAQKTILINTNYVNLKRIFGNLTGRGILLPKNDIILSAVKGDKLAEACTSLSKLINSIIR